MAVKNIEKFFLNTLLKVSVAGVLLILLFDLVLYPEDRLSLLIDIIVLAGCLGAYFMRKKHPRVATFTVTLVVLATMVAQCILVPLNTTTSLSIILVVGFLFSVMLRGRTMLVMHLITYLSIHAIFVFQYFNPQSRLSDNVNELVTVAITYTILYFILTYAAAKLKAAYDKLYESLQLSHEELHRKAREFEAQNAELIRTHNNLNTLNSMLEDTVNERTARVKQQNEILLKYAYANAHHLRGPVARLLGLANISRLDSSLEQSFIIARMEEQAQEIDEVIRTINDDLDQNNIITNYSSEGPEEPEVPVEVLSINGIRKKGP